MSIPLSQPLKVLHVTVSMSAEIGGPSSVCAGLTGALADRGHLVSIATLEEPGQTPLPLHPAVQIHRFPRSGSSRYAVSRSLSNWLGGNISGFDIVHLHSLWQFPTFAAARACWAAGKPYVTALHGMLDTYSVAQHSAWLKRAYWAFRERRIQARAAGIHCLNQAEIRKAVPWIQGMPKFVLPNGIDQAQLDALPARGLFRAAHAELADRPLVLFLSRLHPKKGLDRLIPAWKALAARIPAARLLIAGTGEKEYVDSLARLARTHQLGDAVVFLGQLTGMPKWQALVDADVFVLPSHQEGFSMAVTEALAAGVPPVVTEECNFDELMPADSAAGAGAGAGVIIKGGDMGAFVGAVGDLLENPERRRSLAMSGQGMVARQFTWQKLAAQLEGVYRDILQGKRLEAAPQG